MAKPKHILIADDNQANLLIAKTILERDGYKISCVHNGQQAVNLIKAQIETNACKGSSASPFDIVLMDILMPVMDGLKALRRIKALSDQIIIPQIFAFTAFCSPSDENRYRQAGFDAILTKPLKHGDVQRAVKSVIIGTPNAPVKASPITVLDFSAVNLLDDVIINQLRSLTSPDRLAQIQSTFWADAKMGAQLIPRDLPAALNADTQGLQNLRKTIHSLKGISASIGLLRVTHIARRLQNAPPSQISGLITALFETLILSKTPLSTALGATCKAQNISPLIQNFAAAQQIDANVRTG